MKMSINKSLIQVNKDEDGIVTLSYGDFSDVIGENLFIAHMSINPADLKVIGEALILAAKDYEE